MAYGTVQADIIQSSVTGVSLGAGNATRFKNRIINGNMVIDQRNAGAILTPAAGGGYMTDRWAYSAGQSSKFTAQQTPSATETGYATRVAAGFNNYLAMTVSSAVTIGASDYFNIVQKIEGFNFSDLAWGTSSAKTVTLSFLAYSSLTGTFGGSIVNSAQNRSYPFSYSIPTANTWTQISVTIAGDTTGTWVGATNGVGVQVFFGLGVGTTYSGTAGAWAGSLYLSATGATSVVGTSGATFYITGVQLEVGSSATGFDFRDYGTELIMCQRYCIPMGDGVTGAGRSTTQFLFSAYWTQPMRTAPSATITDTSILISNNYTLDPLSSGSTLDLVQTSAYGGRISISGFTALTPGAYYAAYGNTYGYFLILSAEL